MFINFKTFVCGDSGEGGYTPQKMEFIIKNDVKMILNILK
tara:strand:- start:54 stop:173 length:120 start_codon:yes stop_codon:yes gene_type:complete